MTDWFYIPTENTSSKNCGNVVAGTSPDNTSGKNNTKRMKINNHRNVHKHRKSVCFNENPHNTISSATKCSKNNSSNADK